MKLEYKFERVTQFSVPIWKIWLINYWQVSGNLESNPVKIRIQLTQITKNQVSDIIQ